MASQLFIVLCVVSQHMNEYQQKHALAKAPTLLEFLSYTFSLGNLLAGPYFEFKDYKDFIDGTGVSA